MVRLDLGLFESMISASNMVMAYRLFGDITRARCESQLAVGSSGLNAR